MQLSKEQTDVIIKNGQARGLSGKAVLDGLIQRGYEPEGVNVLAVKQATAPKPKQNFLQDAVGDFKQIGTDILSGSQKGVDKMKTSADAFQSGDQSLGDTALQTVGAFAGSGANAIGSAFKGALKLVLPQGAEDKLKQLASSGMQNAMQDPLIASVTEKAKALYDSMDDTQKRSIDAVGGITSLVSEFVGVGVAKRGATLAKEGIDVGLDVVKQGAKNTADVAINASKVTRDRVFNTLSPEIDKSFRSIFTKAKTEKFDDFVKTAEKASSDVNAPSVYEKVAENMSNATKQLESQSKSLSAQKKTIIEKAKVGLVDFRKETGQVILDINKSLKNNPTANQFIERLRSVKNKLDADNAIDELQNTLYKGNKDMTIPLGSKEDKMLKGILGKYNAELKSSLPKSYSDINTSISNNLKAINVLNRSLGETVNGVSTRGAGLVKQFFSPAGTKTKQLFDYIQKTTGVNLAEDAVLAKYIGEAFGDTKLKSLLEGLPTTKSGILDKTIDFALEKSGINKALNTAKQKGMLKKARELTLPKNK